MAPERAGRIRGVILRSMTEGKPGPFAARAFLICGARRNL